MALRRSDWYFERLCDNPTRHFIHFGLSMAGRDETAFISCRDVYVSRKHLYIRYARNRPHILIEDLKTANGTYINNERIPSKDLVNLLESDILSLGLPVTSMEDVNSHYAFKVKKLRPGETVDLISSPENPSNTETTQMSQGAVASQDDLDRVMEMIHASQPIPNSIPVQQLAECRDPSISDTASQIPRPLDITSNIPKTLDTTSQMPKTSDTSSDMPRIVDITSQMSKALDTTNRMPKIIDTTSQTSKVLDTTNQIPRIVGTTTQMSKVLDTTSQMPRVVDTSIQMSKALDTNNQMPRTLDTTSDMPKTLDTINQMSKSLDTTSSIPRNLDTTSEMPRILDTTSQMPRALDTTTQMPSAKNSPSTLLKPCFVIIERNLNIQQPLNQSSGDRKRKSSISLKSEKSTVKKHAPKTNSHTKSTSAKNEQLPKDPVLSECEDSRTKSTSAKSKQLPKDPVLSEREDSRTKSTSAKSKQLPKDPVLSEREDSRTKSTSAKSKQLQKDPVLSEREDISKVPKKRISRSKSMYVDAEEYRPSTSVCKEMERRKSILIEASPLRQSLRLRKSARLQDEGELSTREKSDQRSDEDEPSPPKRRKSIIHSPDLPTTSDQKSSDKKLDHKNVKSKNRSEINDKQKDKSTLKEKEKEKSTQKLKKSIEKPIASAVTNEKEKPNSLKPSEKMKQNPVAAAMAMVKSSIPKAPPMRRHSVYTSYDASLNRRFSISEATGKLPMTKKLALRFSTKSPERESREPPPYSVAVSNDSVDKNGNFTAEGNIRLRFKRQCVVDTENNLCSLATDAISSNSVAKKIPYRRDSTLDNLYEPGLDTRSNQILSRRKSVSFTDQSDEPKSLLKRRFSTYYPMDNNRIEGNKDCHNRPSTSRQTTLLPVLKKRTDSEMSDWLWRFLSYVIKWNPMWLVEYTSLETTPPIFHDTRCQVPVMLYTYKNYEQYSETLISLIILETWESVYSAYMSKQNRENFTFSIYEQPIKPWAETKIYKMKIKGSVIQGSADLSSSKYNMSYGTVILVKFHKLPTFENVWFIGFIMDCEIRMGSASEGREAVITMYTKLNDLLFGDAFKNTPVKVRLLSSCKNEIQWIRNIYMLRQSPFCNMIVTPVEEHFRMFRSNSPLQWKHDLNKSQLRAVQQCICAIRSNTPTIQLIQGPPGTGKSRVIVSLVMEYLQLPKGQRGKVLLCSQTNNAIDEIVKKLIEIRDNLKDECKFRLVRVGRYESMQPWSQDLSSTTIAKKFEFSPEMKQQVKILEENIRKYRSKEKIAGPQGIYNKRQGDHYSAKLDDLLNGSALQNEEVLVIQSADIIATTLHGSTLFKLLNLKKQISFCVIDEAAKCTEPEVLAPLDLGFKSLVLVGDHQQLGGFVTSQRAKKKGLSESMFSRLIHCTESWKNSATMLLDVQYRMHPEIARFPNMTFYEGKLSNGVDYSPLPPNLPPYRVVSIPSEGMDQGNNVNNYEAGVVARLALAIKGYIKAQNLNLSICVLTPYSAQKDALCHKILRIDMSSDLEVQTVDSFQGQERDVIIISLARSSGVGFLNEPGRMTVLLTRAKRSCIICCDPTALKSHDLWDSFLDDAKSRKVFKSVPKSLCNAKYLDIKRDIATLLKHIQ